MPKKGKAKNTVNKKKHTKLMNRKINKVKQEKIDHNFNYFYDSINPTIK